MTYNMSLSFQFQFFVYFIIWGASLIFFKTISGEMRHSWLTLLNVLNQIKHVICHSNMHFSSIPYHLLSDSGKLLLFYNYDYTRGK